SDAKRSPIFTGQDSAHPVRLRSDQRSGLLGVSARVAYTNLFPQSQRLSETRSVRTCTRFSRMRPAPVRRLRQPAAESLNLPPSICVSSGDVCTSGQS